MFLLGCPYGQPHIFKKLLFLAKLKFSRSCYTIVYFHPYTFIAVNSINFFYTVPILPVNGI